MSTGLERSTVTPQPRSGIREPPPPGARAMEGSVEPGRQQARNGCACQADGSKNGGSCDLWCLLKAYELDVLPDVEEVSHGALAGHFAFQPSSPLSLRESRVSHDLFVPAELAPEMLSAAVNSPPEQPDTERRQHAADCSQDGDRQLHSCTMRCTWSDMEAGNVNSGSRCQGSGECLTA